MVDLKAELNSNLASTGASPELTGPGAHGNAAPFPGSFGIGANVDHFPGLVVLLSSTRGGAGAGQNVANDFTITTRSEEHTSELQSLAYLVCRLLLEKKTQPSRRRH